MYDFEIFDSMYGELQNISKKMDEIKELLNQQIKVENVNNILLRMLLTGEKIEYSSPNLFENVQKDYRDKNTLIINPSKKESIKFARMITSNISNNFFISTAKSESEFATELMGAIDGTYIFVDISDSGFNEKMGQMLYDCVKNRYIKVNIGKGEFAREVQLDIPEIKFIVYTYMEELLPDGLSDILEKV